MTITAEQYAIVTDYIIWCTRGVQLNPTRLKLCRWIIEKVADGTITVEGDFSIISPNPDTPLRMYDFQQTNGTYPKLDDIP